METKDYSDEAKNFVEQCFDKIDSKIIGKNRDKRKIEPSENLKSYIETAFTFYIEACSSESNIDFDYFVFVLLEVLLYLFLEGKGLEGIINGLIEQLGQNYSYESNAFISSTLINSLISYKNQQYSNILSSIDKTFGKIIFHQKELFMKYYFALFNINNKLLATDEDAKIECENIILNFLFANNSYFKIPKVHLESYEALSNYLCYMENPGKYPINELRESQDTQETEHKDNNNGDSIFEKEEETIISKQNPEEKTDIISESNEAKIDSNYVIKKINELTLANSHLQKEISKINGINAQITLDNSRLNNEISKIKGINAQITLDNSRLNNEISKIKGDAEEKYNKQKKLIFMQTLKIQNIESKLQSIQSRDLWKAIVNYNLYHLGIGKKGYYYERVEDIINKLQKYKNSEVYIKFFKNVKEFIITGNEYAHDFSKKFIVGMETRYVDTLIKETKFSNMSYPEIKSVKKILIKINAEQMLKRYIDGGDAVDDNQEKIDIQNVLLNLEENK